MKAINRTRISKLTILALCLLATSVATQSTCGNGCKTCSGGTCNECRDGFRLSGGSCTACQANGCKTCQTSTSACEACKTGWFASSGASPSLTCSQCVENCDVCDNTRTCITCNSLSKKNEEETCDLDTTKIIIILAIVFGSIILCIVCCCMCCNHSRKVKRDKRKHKAKKNKNKYNNNNGGFGNPNMMAGNQMQPMGYAGPPPIPGMAPGMNPGMAPPPRPGMAPGMMGYQAPPPQPNYARPNY